MSRERLVKKFYKVRFFSRLNLTRIRQVAFDRKNLIGEAQHIEVTHVLGANQTDGCPRFARSSRTPRAVNIVLCRVGKVRVDYVSKMGDVDASGGDISTNQKAKLSFARGRHDTLAIVLRQIGIEPVGGVAHSIQRLGEAFGLIASIAKDDGALRVLYLQDLYEFIGLISRAAVDIMLDRQRADMIATEGNKFRIIASRFGDSPYVRGECRAKE